MTNEPANPNPLREAYFGDLHVHTAYSLDSHNLGAVNTPNEAYEFAKGAPKLVYKGGPEVKLTAPLDFMAVTDHSEWMAETSLVLDENFEIADPEAHALLMRMRNAKSTPEGFDYEVMIQHVMRGMFLPNPVHEAFAPPEAEETKKHFRSMWQYMVETANKHYDPGQFTTFVGYEWSATPSGANLHRCVIFRTDEVPDAPLSYIDTQNPEELWQWMQKEAGGSDNVLAIPHNPNLSGGLMFLPQYFAGQAIDRDYAETRQTMEPLIEIHQIKGTSEVNPLLATTDEFANFEQLGGGGAVAAKGPNSYSFVRDGLKEGLRQADRLGANPFTYGVIGSTDNHTGTPGDTEEYDWEGSHPHMDTSPEGRLLGKSEELFTMIESNPGGLAGVWAEENTRDSIFRALRRKETFGTSGVRIRPRFFGGWDFAVHEEENERLAEVGYEKGIPMGGELPSRPGGSAVPNFMVQAAKDPLSGNLDRIQIVKGWTHRGEVFERIYDVAWSGDRTADSKTGKLPQVGNTVDVKEASYTNDIGASELSGAWTDPDFDPSMRAFYYARVIEIPTPRWSTYDARRLGVDAPEPATVQERAWTSPIWYTPTDAELRQDLDGEKDVFTVENFREGGVGPLSTEELRELTVGKTLRTKNLVTGQEAIIHYGEDGERTVFFDPHRVVRSSYEIKDGKRIEQTTQGVEIVVTVYRLGHRYIAAREDQGGYCNFEIVPD